MTLRNHYSDEQFHTLTTTLGDEWIEEWITLNSGEHRTVSLTLPTSEPGTETLEEAAHPVTIVHSEMPQLRGVPDKALPGSEPLVEVRTATNDLLANATVMVGEEIVETRSNGSV